MTHAESSLNLDLSLSLSRSLRPCLPPIELKADLSLVMSRGAA